VPVEANAPWVKAADADVDTESVKTDAKMNMYFFETMFFS
jgi:hypothetical protein